MGKKSPGVLGGCAGAKTRWPIGEIDQRFPLREESGKTLNVRHYELDRSHTEKFHGPPRGPNAPFS